MSPPITYPTTRTFGHRAYRVGSRFQRENATVTNPLATSERLEHYLPPQMPVATVGRREQVASPQGDGASSGGEEEESSLDPVRATEKAEREMREEMEKDLAKQREAAIISQVAQLCSTYGLTVEEGMRMCGLLPGSEPANETSTSASSSHHSRSEGSREMSEGSMLTEDLLGEMPQLSPEEEAELEERHRREMREGWMRSRGMLVDSGSASSNPAGSKAHQEPEGPQVPEETQVPQKPQVPEKPEEAEERTSELGSTWLANQTWGITELVEENNKFWGMGVCPPAWIAKAMGKAYGASAKGPSCEVADETKPSSNLTKSDHATRSQRVEQSRSLKTPDNTTRSCRVEQSDVEAMKEMTESTARSERAGDSDIFGDCIDQAEQLARHTMDVDCLRTPTQPVDKKDISEGMGRWLQGLPSPASSAAPTISTMSQPQETERSSVWGDYQPRSVREYIDLLIAAEEAEEQRLPDHLKFAGRMSSHSAQPERKNTRLTIIRHDRRREEKPTADIEPTQQPSPIETQAEVGKTSYPMVNRRDRQIDVLAEEAGLVQRFPKEPVAAPTARKFPQRAFWRASYIPGTLTRCGNGDWPVRPPPAMAAASGRPTEGLKEAGKDRAPEPVPVPFKKFPGKAFPKARYIPGNFGRKMRKLQAEIWEQRRLDNLKTFASVEAAAEAPGAAPVEVAASIDHEEWASRLQVAEQKRSEAQEQREAEPETEHSTGITATIGGILTSVKGWCKLAWSKVKDAVWG
ncbi:hypothetical protein KC340_g13331 [Hortaea werneckii]|nr:hypothetical protein KC342_g13656 [Hortaea werneckii]KAI7097054.1 hypothetical protein KC339_g9945 [Hortaea werneckii]KAI7300549.1 hypothetical protein KC340_g13331 [Hortaea werneckii]KAI7376567.1 hypothetical protein KC328_g14841 [Hortaea werneckii]